MYQQWLHKIGKATSDKCPRYKEVETPKHIVFECKKIVLYCLVLYLSPVRIRVVGDRRAWYRKMASEGALTWKDWDSMAARDGGDGGDRFGGNPIRKRVDLIEGFFQDVQWQWQA